MNERNTKVIWFISGWRQRQGEKKTGIKKIEKGFRRLD